MNENIVSLSKLIEIRKSLKQEGKKVVFTNGCFDIIHAGHVDYLSKAKALGDVLIIGVNSDSSIKRIKGEKRPIVQQDFRAIVLANLKCVDYVVFFEEDTPKELIEAIIPDILIKGGDWAIESIVGKDIVEKNGGSVKTINFVNNISTSQIIEAVLTKYN